jgi:hypothetical protein
MCEPRKRAVGVDIREYLTGSWNTRSLSAMCQLLELWTQTPEPQFTSHNMEILRISSQVVKKSEKKNG